MIDYQSLLREVKKMKYVIVCLVIMLGLLVAVSSYPSLACDEQPWASDCSMRCPSCGSPGSAISVQETRKLSKRLCIYTMVCSQGHMWLCAQEQW
jgi:hypothetical protein